MSVREVGTANATCDKAKASRPHALLRGGLCPAPSGPTHCRLRNTHRLGVPGALAFRELLEKLAALLGLLLGLAQPEVQLI